MICVHKSPDIQEMFHRQNFFFFNFAYLCDYGVVSYKYDNYITIHKNECYIGQPYSGYALSAHSEKETMIIGILIQKEAFFKIFLPVLSADTQTILQPVMLTLLMMVARQYKQSFPVSKDEKVSSKIVRYMGEHYKAQIYPWRKLLPCSDTVTAAIFTKRFGSTITNPHANL